jgi:hypothetical protein
MAVQRTRSKDIETGTGNQRINGDLSINRTHLNRSTVGADELGPGSVNTRHYGARGIQEQNVRPGLVPRERFGWEQTPSRTEVVAERTNDFPIRVGGTPLVVVRLTSTLSTAGEMVFYKNDDRFDTLMSDSLRPGPWLLAMPTATREFSLVFDIQFRAGDFFSAEITDAGVGGEGIVLDVRLLG